MLVSVADIRRLFDTIMSEVEKTVDADINIPVRLYYDISVDAMFSMKSDLCESSVSIGDLLDDWKELQKILVGQRDALAYDLVKLGNLLRVLGYAKSELISNENITETRENPT